jgi:uncharacterized membrane protein YkoI
MKLKLKLATGVLAAGVALAGAAYAPQVMASPTAPQGAPQTGAQAEPADKGETQDDAAVLSRATVTAEQAQAAAVKAYPGATVNSTTLEDENGTPTYGVQLTTGGKQYDVKVNALTGTVVRADADGEDNN